MSKRKQVGRSHHTPYKHWILNSHLGKIAGVLSNHDDRVPANPDPFLCVDLCAGDGKEPDDAEQNRPQTSPGIIHKHCEWLASRGIPVKSVFIEKQVYTFEALKSNSPSDVHPMHQRRIYNDDARDFVLIPSCDNQAIFVNCDPNVISDLPMAEAFANSLTPTTTMTLTLGCNVGGVKRLEPEKRQSWREYVGFMVDIMPSWHDALLVEVVRDADQWAYLTRLPYKWSKDQSATMKRAGENMFKHGVCVASISREPKLFREILDRLFTTKRERGEA